MLCDNLSKVIDRYTIKSENNINKIENNAANEQSK